MDVPLQLTMAITPAHRNEYLFSDHYLDSLLPQDPRWEGALGEAGAFLGWLQGLYAQERNQLSRYNEDQLEEHWFKPILRQLGHVFEGQAGVPGLDAGVKRPDYVFFPDEGTRQAAAGAQNTQEYATEALAVGEVKRWEVPLSRKQEGGGASFEAQNPSWQVDYYVRTTGVRWGVLSSGRRWRLVHRDTSERLSIYYEVDLVDLLSRGEAGVMRYFLLFFQQAAFRPDGQGRVFLEDALAASKAYAVALEEDVEANVYQALERLMQGFLGLPANGLGTGDLREIYENSLYLLYRLLFILYGESRGLLPLHLTSYRDSYSLDRLKREIAGLKVAPAPMTTIYWGRLKQLFQIINGDNVELNRHLGVPRYNGGLFDPAQHPFLERCAVGDRALVEAIDLLSRRTTDGTREFVDYRTLGVRHLGSIYEGLLEYQPRYAGEPMVAVREDKGERWVKAAEVPEGARVVVRRGVGQVYLETDRGERRATGSYYTPQYIVEYIVEQAVGPLVKEAVERVKARGKQAKGKAARAAAGRSLVEEVLRLKILDPAMGSGHFLVEATEYLARALATDPYVETGVPAEEDLTHWKRRVVEQCIYGVDRNRLAVELAKLSLWLATVAEDKPLSFLDHHLQCGDSLIGARVADLGAVPPVVLSKKALREREAQYAAGVRQANLFEIRLIEKLPVVMGRILEITEVESDSYETVQAKEAADRAVQQLKAPFQAVANLWVSAYFGNEFTQGEYDEALGLVGRPGELLALPAVGWAQEAARERRFFHWELAFPEVFYDRNGQPLRAGAGFDAVVGNPPYGFIADKAVQTILSNTYHAVSSFDLYIAFLERGIQLLRRQGILSYIAPTSWQTGIAHQDFREYSLRTCQIARIVDLPYDVFPDAYIDTSIYVLKKELTPEEASTLLNRPVLAYKFGKRAQAATGLSGALAYEVLDSGDWLGDPQLRFVTDKGVLNLRGALANLPQVSLGELTDTARGILAGEADLSAMPLGPDWKPYFDGDVYRYQLNWEPKMWVQYGSALREKPSDYHYFLGPRILVRRLISRQARLMATLVSEEFVNTKDLYNVLVAGERHNPLFLAALLNSLLFSHLYIAQSTVASRDDFPQVTLADLRKLPIRHIAFATPAGERARLGGIGITEATEWTEHAEMASVSSFPFSAFGDSALGRWLEARLTAEPQQSDVVHDLLAYLAERMIGMNREKQTEVRGFLAWLEREIGAPVEGLTHRTHLQNYLGDYQKGEPHLAPDELLEVLRQNRRRLHVDPSARVFQERLAQEYQASLDRLLPLKARLAATDRLIDLVVYRLYGLTEEEVAVVEGRR